MDQAFTPHGDGLLGQVWSKEFASFSIESPWGMCFLLKHSNVYTYTYLVMCFFVLDFGQLNHVFL